MLQTHAQSIGQSSHPGSIRELASNKIYMFCTSVVSDQETLPLCVRPYLERQLDWGHGGVEKDLSEIAKHLDNWEEVAPHLELAPIDIHDIKEKHQNKPSLQRCVMKIVIENCLYDY